METVADSEITGSLDFPTATPVLDVLRPSPPPESERLSTGDYFFVSSAVMIAFIQLSHIHAFIDFISTQPLVLFWIGLLALPSFAFLVAIAVHQSGHLLAARMTGLETVALKFGPFSIREKLEPADVLSLGFAVFRPRGTERLRPRLAVLFFGGPLASILAPVLLETTLRLAQNHWGSVQYFASAGVHLFSAVSLLLGVSSLLPDINSTGNFSDGTRLLMLLKNDFRAVRLLAALQLQSGLNSGAHLSTWGEDLVACATAQKDESFDTVAAHWLAYLWASTRQDLTEATRYLEEALSGLGPSPGHLRERVFLEAAIYQAWYRHNLVKSRIWASQIARPDVLSPLERTRLEIASCWAEGKLFAAWEMLQDYLRRIREMPESPLRASVETDALEWKAQMESRMLAGAWATMHSWPYERQTQMVV